MTLTDNDIQELRDALFETTAALEELICAQEGLLPKRLLESQKGLGYHDARKMVLNGARTQLRRTKTYMLRAGTLKTITETITPAQGEHLSNVERAIPRPMPEPQRFAWPHPGRSPVLLFAVAAVALYVIGFWVPHIHWIIAGVLSGLILYCGLTFGK